MKNFSIFVLFLFSIHSFAQQNKVIIISNKYEFQKEKNTYNINTMLKAILVSNNYQVFFDDEVLPVEIAQNRCKALAGVLVDNSNMFLTKMKFQIRDCQNNLLFETAEVKTREKDIQNAYIEIVGTEQNVLLFLQRTKTPNVFIAYKEGVNGIFTKTDNKGIFEYYIGAKYMVEEYLF